MLDRLRQFLYGEPEHNTREFPKQTPSEEAAPTRRVEAPPAVPEASSTGDETPSAMGDPQAYLARVQEKMNRLAEEFASGKINRAQFQELFEHYRREQQTVQRFVAMSPEDEAWQDVTTEGKSVLIREQNVARVLGYAIYDNESGMPFNTIGEFEVDAELVIPMLSSYRAATKEIFGAGMRSTEIEGGRWLGYVPGEFTTLMALFSTDPASQQLESIEKLHLLFERANRNLLSEPPVDPNQLALPHESFLGRYV